MSESSMVGKSVLVVVIEHEAIHAISGLNDVDALALQACASEDPASWDDLALVWPRYKFHPENSEFANLLSMRQVDLQQALEMLEDAEAWLVLDLVERRMLTGGRFSQVRQRLEPTGKSRSSAPILALPPCWELCQQVDANQITAQRQSPLRILNPRRDVLWGTAMTKYFAERMLAAVQAGVDWIGRDREGNPCGKYRLTVGIHRDWLMTPRDELAGGIPRDCLHLGMEWIDDLADGQVFRVYQDEEPIPLSTDLSTYQSAAMGRHEVVVYFLACRETMAAGWRWLLADERRVNAPQAARQLAEVMDSFLAEWLVNPLEDGPPPAEIIRCDRVRIPLVEQADQHVVDCDCPICDMIASGVFGPSIVHFDGHTLELDGEFAFSIHANRKDWEAEQCEWDETDEDDELDLAADAPQTEVEEHSAVPDALDSVWPAGQVAEAGIPGDNSGHLAMAFLVAELVSRLQSANADQADVNRLNAAFRSYRSATCLTESISSAEHFKQVLEQMATEHIALVSQAADLQSRIDERMRERPTA